VKPLLQARDLRFGYTAAKSVIGGISLSIASGSVSAIIGANGCGKSTLIRLLAGILAPASGQIEFEGAPLKSIDARVLAQKVAYVPQTTSNTFPFTALEVVLTGRSPYLRRLQFERPIDVAKARAAMAQLSIEHLEHRPMTQLSGGERQLVSLARAIAQEPLCLLLDEPSASLDLKHRAAIMRQVAAERDRTGRSALIVTHDLMLIDECDAVVALRQGRIAASGSPADVLNRGVLGDIYQDSNIRVRRIDGRTFVWSQP
jgi:iron complex transport system ATP-binding protein